MKNPIQIHSFQNNYEVYCKISSKRGGGEKLWKKQTLNQTILMFYFRKVFFCLIVNCYSDFLSHFEDIIQFTLFPNILYILEVESG